MQREIALLPWGRGRGMKKVELYAQVRYAVQIEGISRREAGRRFGIDPRTVAKMLQFSVPPGYRRSGAPRRPKLDPFTGIIDQILADDRTPPVKQRHTSRLSISSGASRARPRFQISIPNPTGSESSPPTPEKEEFLGSLLASHQKKQDGGGDRRNDPYLMRSAGFTRHDGNGRIGWGLGLGFVAQNGFRAFGQKGDPCAALGETGGAALALAGDGVGPGRIEIGQGDAALERRADRPDLRDQLRIGSARQFGAARNTGF